MEQEMETWEGVMIDLPWGSNRHWGQDSVFFKPLALRFQTAQEFPKATVQYVTSTLPCLWFHRTWVQLHIQQIYTTQVQVDLEATLGEALLPLNVFHLLSYLSTDPQVKGLWEPSNTMFLKCLPFKTSPHVLRFAEPFKTAPYLQAKGSVPRLLGGTSNPHKFLGKGTQTLILNERRVSGCL